jgi:hypothetical protein
MNPSRELSTHIACVARAIEAHEGRGFDRMA